MLTYVQSEKGKQMLLYEGHIFEVNKRTHEGRIIWRCKEYYHSKFTYISTCSNDEVLRIICISCM